MKAQLFLFWLKGYINALDLEGATYSKDHINRIQTMLELAIKSSQQEPPIVKITDPKDIAESYKYFSEKV